MEIKVDYHFHPNLPKSDIKAKNKSLEWWKVFKNHNITSVLVTEHVYKNAQRAYHFMSETCPNNFFCFPGIEYVTKEGIDIIVFSHSDLIYKIKELNTPFFFSYKELIDFVFQNEKLHAFITHPFTLGHTSVVKKLGLNMYFEYLYKLKSVEVSNGSFVNLLKLMSVFPFNLFLQKKIKWAKNNFNLPNKYRPFVPKFLAVGSDAHIFEDVNLSVNIEVDMINKERIFESIISNKNDSVSYVENRLNILSIIKNLAIVLNEFFIKLKIRLWNNIYI
jgi:hypothetical protein